jgi:DNA-binding transcriptional LysR family regulator
MTRDVATWQDPSMELRHLRYFVAVADALHFGEAAAKLHIAQPSLSHQIQQLETELQTTLLRRTKRHVELTEAGRLFLNEARDIVARTDRAAVVARRVGSSDVPRLRVGVGYCMDQADIAAAVGLYNVKHPDVQVELKTMSVPAQIAALRDGRLDVGFVRPPITDPALRSEVIVREPLVVALPPTYRLVRRSRIPLPALANEPFVLPPRDAVPVFHDTVVRLCREAGFVPHAPHEADHLQMIIAMVASGAGVGLVPIGARKFAHHAVVYRPLHPAPDALETSIAWRRDEESQAVFTFAAEVRRTLAPRRTSGARARQR